MGLRWSNGGRRLTLAARQLLAMPTWPANGNASFVFWIECLGEKTGGKNDHRETRRAKKLWREILYRGEFPRAQQISQARKRLGSSSSNIWKSLLALESLDCGGLGKRSFTFIQISSSIPNNCEAVLSLYKDRTDAALSGAMVDGKDVSFTTHREIIWFILIYS